jgi:hypothetical protein
MPKVVFVYNAENAKDPKYAKLQIPGEVDVDRAVPPNLAPGKGVKVEPARDGLLMWAQAAVGVAFVGVINIRSARLHLRPLVPRVIVVDKKPVTESIEYKPAEQVIVGKEILQPIDHNKNSQTAHDQLRKFVVTSEGIKEADADAFAGFAVTKRAGTE